TPHCHVRDCLYLLRHSAPQDTPSFPTRRSSDLRELLPAEGGGGELPLRHETGPAARRHLPAGHAPAGVEPRPAEPGRRGSTPAGDRKSTRLNSSHVAISYAVFCLK